MRVLQRIIATCLMVVGLSMAVWAQKDQEKPKPKPSPPVVDPIKKPPPGPKKPKPGMAIIVLGAVGKLENS